MEPNYIIAIIATVPVLLVPVIAWILSQRGVSRRAKEIQSLLTRMELVEKLRQVKEQTSVSKDRLVGILDKEISHILDDVESIREIQAPWTRTRPDNVARWRKFLLLYKQTSLNGNIYKGLFYGFVFFAVFGVLSIVVRRIFQATWDEMFIPAVFTVFYLIVGLCFRAAAAKEYARIMGKKR